MFSGFDVQSLKPRVKHLCNAMVQASEYIHAEAIKLEEPDHSHMMKKRNARLLCYMFGIKEIEFFRGFKHPLFREWAPNLKAFVKDYLVLFCT